MSIAAPCVVLFCVLAVGGWVAAALDSLTFALIARQPLSPATVALPWRRGARDLLRQCLRTDRPDLMNWLLAPAVYLLLAPAGLMVVPFAPCLVVADFAAGIVLLVDYVAFPALIRVF